MTTLQLHEAFVLVDETTNGIIAIYESKEEAEEIAKKVNEKYGSGRKIIKADFYGKLPQIII